ncbi:alpha/beta hydrolase domain-containing protein [Nocardia fluminea]|uniref:alpha/beta hydrolase domain-containing protein n=1 Tax=Nocardia fluminea TaxID=134984 RepID=UPI00366C5E71
MRRKKSTCLGDTQADGDQSRLSRRAALGGFAFVGLSVVAIPSVLAACGQNEPERPDSEGSVSVPVISGPVSGGSRGQVFGGTVRDLASVGYVEEEYFIEGEAHRIDVTDTPADGRFVSEKETASAPYRTRLVVRRPIDPARFNGTLIVHWSNVSAGWEHIDDFEAVADGFAFLAVSAQRVGLEGFPGVPFGLKSWDPDRYGSLHIAGDSYSFDIFSQAARAVGAGGARRGADPLHGLAVRHRVAMGASQSAQRLVSQLNAVQPIDHAFDGYLQVVDFGAYIGFNDADADDGKAGQTEYTPEGFAANNVPMTRKRDDLGVKVLVVNSETEARTWHAVAQPDTDAHRAWFVSGSAHMGALGGDVSRRASERDGLPGDVMSDVTPSLIDFSGVVEAGMHAMHRWLESGQAPSSQPRLEFVADDTRLARDADGMAEGGIRLPAVAVPAAVNAGEGPDMRGFAGLSGTSTPFPIEKIRALYPSDDDYRARVKDVAGRLVADGVILQRTADRYLAETETAWLGSTTPR